MTTASAQVRPGGNPARAPIVPEPAPPRGVVVVHPARCKGCELCVEHCPVRVLELSADFNDAGYHYPVLARDACIACQACSAICPDLAIFAIPIESFERARELGLAV
jgi:2-oxoglutarate ferredoxin oxidoreductase subunit delta